MLRTNIQDSGGRAMKSAYDIARSIIDHHAAQFIHSLDGPYSPRYEQGE